MRVTRQRDDGEAVQGMSVGPLFMLAILFDWYPRADGPVRIGLLLGGASLPVRDDTEHFDERVPIGGGSGLELGYEWKIARRWSSGVTLRFMGARLEAGGVQHNFAALTLLGTVTFF
jgi:hypothetical protein